MSRRPSAPQPRAPSFVVAHLPVLNGLPKRAVASFNMRYHEKRKLDVIQAYWSAKLGRALHHWDVMSLILALAVDHPMADVPREILAELDAAHDDGGEPP